MFLKERELWSQVDGFLKALDDAKDLGAWKRRTYILFLEFEDL